MESIVLTYSLALRTKLMCACAPAQSCPVCQGYPAMLPLLNREALRRVVVAAGLLSCRLCMSRFYRVPLVREGALRRCLSMRPEPPAQNGGFLFNGNSIPISKIYLQESFCGTPPVYGIAQLCVEALSSDPAFVPALTALLQTGGAVDSGCTVSLWDEARDICLEGTELARLRSLECPGIYSGTAFFDTAIYPIEAETNLCLMHIDPVTGAHMRNGEYDDSENS